MLLDASNSQAMGNIATFHNGQLIENKVNIELYRQIHVQYLAEETPQSSMLMPLTQKLERVLSEVLEEELKKELESKLGPTLCKIKEQIPSIIKRCIVQLLQTRP